MATQLTRAVTIDDARIRRGGHRAVYAPAATAFPAKIEDVIDLSTMALKTGWEDLGPTSADGFEITREADRSEGVEIDQRDYNLGAGNVTGMTMGGTCTMMYTDGEALKLKWEFGDLVDIPAVTGATPNVHQQAYDIGNVEQLTARRFAIFQQHPKTGMMSMFVFRQATPEIGGSITVKGKNPEGTELTLVFEPDSSITDGTDFGRYFEQLPT